MKDCAAVVQYKKNYYWFGYLKAPVKKKKKKSHDCLFLKCLRNLIFQCMCSTQCFSLPGSGITDFCDLYKTET